MAKEAAEKMASALYDEELNRLTEQLTLLATKYVAIYYPTPVLKVIEEYSDYFDTCDQVYIRIQEDRTSIRCKSNIRVPLERSLLIVPKKHAEPLLDKNAAIFKLKNQKAKFINEVVYALGRELKYEDKVRKMMPEALPYITFPTVKQLPALNEDHFSELRNKINSIK